MNSSVDLAAMLCRNAEHGLTELDLVGAISDARRALLLVASDPDILASEITARASLALAEGLALRDDLRKAERVVDRALRHATWRDTSDYRRALLALKMAEIQEMRHEYTLAANTFLYLIDHFSSDEWGAALVMRCANHLISIGIHNAKHELAEVGVITGSRIRRLVGDPDEVSAWLQWRGLYESRLYRWDDAAATLEESFTLRAATARRQATKRFLEAEIAFFESDQAGVAALDAALTAATEAGLTRHARAAAEHMSRWLR